MRWVAAEPKPKSEWERLQTADPNDPEHNFRATYAINYALEMVGVRAGRVYTPAENTGHVKQALWKLTEDLRRADERVRADHRIGTSESLFLRDAQRYLYGLQGTRWLQQHIEAQYHVPKIVAEHSSGGEIDGVYNAIKKAALATSAAVEKVTGKSPGLGRTGGKLPLSRPGGDAWFDLGAARYAELNPEAGPAKSGNLLLLAVPALPK